MLGGGTFVTQNKVLPGAYINFVSLASASATLSDRGIATMPLELDWGVEDSVFEVTNEDFRANSMKVFGYPYDHEKMKGLRDLFKNIKTLYAYRLNGGGTKASNQYAIAKFGGVRGNNLKIVIQKNVDDESTFDVQTVMDTTVVDVQTVATTIELQSNDFVTFKSETGLGVIASAPLTGGTDGTVTGESHQAYLDKIESYSFNTLGIITTDETVKTLYVNFCKRLRDEVGMKFQVVLYNKAADYEGVINVKNKITDEGWDESCLVYWVTGASAGCAVNKSNSNKVYDGEFTVDVAYTQAQLVSAIQSGEFVIHKVGSGVRVLEDINSFVTVTDVKGDAFKDNLTIRVIDQIANDDAVLFNDKYLGSVPNNESGRISLWADIVKHREELQNIGAIEEFNDEDVKVEQGENKKSIVIDCAVKPINTMSKLYMTVTIG